MKRRFFLDVIVRQSATIFKLLSGEYQSLLIWRNSLLVLNFSFNIFNGVWCLNFESNSFASESLDKDLHTSSKSKNQMKSGFLLDVVVRKSAAVFELLSSKDQSLLVWRNSLFILNFCFNILDSVWRLNFQSDRLPYERIIKY